ncbi:SOCS box domain-containing protein [Caerostris extrusa]|uniref:SOCS box domain-containing protein n=1 Tax=Caerostris extrusa TaxID=172846 RepID=A0AAV4S3B2_CAEEX|nr:SOCS box domain-containing protein [Caerostris extrusa]
MDPESAAALAQDLLIFSKFSQSSSLSPLNLIDYRNKSETNDFLVEAKRRLKSTICDLFKRNAQGNMENAIDRRLRRTFVPIKILKGKNVCSKCEKTYTVRINQFRLKYNPGCTQQRKDIAGKKFSDHPSVNYLNLIDYSCKAYDFVPYHLTWNFEREIFSHLLPLIEKDIKNFPVKLLPLLLTKHITVLKLLNMESIHPYHLTFIIRSSMRYWIKNFQKHC